MSERQRLSTLTNTVATLFGNIFAVMAKEEVIAAAKPKASIDLTRKHRVMKAGPAGTRSSNLLSKERKDIQLLSNTNQTGRIKQT